MGCATHRHKETLQEFVRVHADREATVYPDDASTYKSLPSDDNTVKRSLSEHVEDDVRTNRTGSSRSMLKRANNGTLHRLSPERLSHHIKESAGHRNIGELDTITQMGVVVQNMARWRLRYRQLIADNGLPSGART